ncbi:hypothetical protein [Nocardioides daeguensis]|uniref:FHA domain-containing protein n=1 Tax=Nocardioides daeguensis TaxID=908359 RepID=A0ABP6V2J2_9ACTN|nr:hypothetical protein [Nocardioides daeguensis]MBV6727278.1 hypothetical protein [Nocardioides daeguensis]MCR1771292.1 hypothetical protein [Nocardioides daeguensis]
MSDAGTAWSYRNGAWFAVFGPEAAVVLPESQKDQVVGLWALVDGGAGFDDVLDGLLASGLSRIPGFVLVSNDAGPTRFLLRGAGVVATVTAAGETVTVDGGASHTWVERSLDDVTALSIDLPTGEDDPAPADTDFPILTGLVRVGRIDRPAAASAPEAAPAPVVGGAHLAVEEPAAVEPDSAEPDSAEPVSAEPVSAEPEVPDVPDVPTGPEVPAVPVSELPDVPAAPDLPEVPAEPAVLDEPSPLDEGGAAATEAAYLDDGPATEVMDSVDEPLADPLGDAPQEPAPDGWVTPWDTPAPPPGSPTEVAPPGWVPPPPPGVPAPDAPPLPVGSWEPVGGVPAPSGPGVEHDGFTVAGPGEPPAPLVPPVPGTPAAPPVTQPVAKLLVSDGQSIIVDRAVLIGRAPEARRFASTEQPMLVTVPSRLHEISSTHVEVRPGAGADLGTAVVTDMGSTNGTVLVQPGLGPEDLKPGIAVQLIPGATINLGDGITIQVTRP